MMQQVRSLVVLTDCSMLRGDSTADRQVAGTLDKAVARSRALHTAPLHSRSPQGGNQRHTDASMSFGSLARCGGARKLPAVKLSPTGL